MYIKSFAIFFGCFLAFYLTHFYLEDFVATAITAVVLGFLAAEVGVCIQHDANHGGFSSSAAVNKWVGTSLDFVGASSFIWKQQHVFGHHVYTNIEGIDPDIRVHDPDVRRTNMFQPWREYQVPHCPFHLMKSRSRPTNTCILDCCTPCCRSRVFSSTTSKCCSAGGSESSQ